MTIDPKGARVTASTGRAAIAKYFPDTDLHNMSSPYRVAATNIYRTKDGRYFHIHGSMNPDSTLDSLGLPHDMPTESMEDSWKPFMEKLAQIDSQEMQRLASDVYK